MNPKFIQHVPPPMLAPIQAVKSAQSELGMSPKELARNGWAGPLNALVHDVNVGEIRIPHPGRVIVRRSNGKDQEEPIVVNQEWLDFLPAFWLSSINRELPKNSIIRETLLYPDGISGMRFMYSPPNVSSLGPSLYIRPFRSVHFSLDDFVSQKMLPKEAAETIKVLLLSGAPVLVSGATASGKTTFLSAMIRYLQENRPLLNLLVVERSHEICPPVRAYRWQESDGQPLDVLAEKATQIGVDWVVLGECTGAEAYFVIKAYTQGVPCASTLHTWSASATFKQIAILAQEYPRAPDIHTLLQMQESINMMAVHVFRMPDGQRRVSGISEIVGVNKDEPICNNWWEWNGQELVYNPGSINEIGHTTRARLKAAGLTLPVPLPVKKRRR